MPDGADVRETAGALSASDGVELAWRSWSPGGDARARLLLLHGVGEHAGRYASLARQLARAGIACYAFDHRGHGQSGGHRGHVDRWVRYEQDAREIVREIVGVAEDPPLFLYGHSMGSLICLTLAIGGYGRTATGFAGWILSGAGIRPTGIAKPHLVAIARLLSRFAPRVSLDLGISSSALSHDPAVVRAYDEDPRVERRATVRWGTEALAAIASIQRGAAGITDPMLVLHGGADPLAEVSGSRWLAEVAGGPTDLIVYEGALHESHNDPEYADVATDIIGWIESRIGSP